MQVLDLGVSILNSLCDPNSRISKLHNVLRMNGTKRHVFLFFFLFLFLVLHNLKELSGNVGKVGVVVQSICIIPAFRTVNLVDHQHKASLGY